MCDDYVMRGRKGLGRCSRGCPHNSSSSCAASSRSRHNHNPVPLASAWISLQLAAWFCVFVSPRIHTHTRIYKHTQSTSTPLPAGARPKGDPTPLSDRDLPLALSPHDLLALMDHLMGLEATWHNGGALARTLYSSLYMMQLHDRLVLLLCLGVGQRDRGLAGKLVGSKRQR